VRLRVARASRDANCAVPRCVQASSRSLLEHPLGIKECNACEHHHTGNDPEPHDNGDFLPTFELKMVMNRTHEENTLPLRDLEVGPLDDYRACFDYEQATDEDEE